MKKILVVVLALMFALTLVLTSCSDNGGDGTSTGNTSGDATKVYNIGICQIAQHPALDAATKGFRDALEKELPGQVKFDEQNASGEQTNCTTIINGFVSKKVDLILANATAPLQAAAAATTEIPVLGTSITDYASALEIDNWTGTVGNNVSGTSDLAPLDQQALLFKEWFPDANRIGIVYCSAEPNSEYQAKVISAELTKLGYTCTNYTFTDSNDIASVVTNACNASDAIYIPTDNAAAANTEAIANIVIPAKVPVIAGEEGICACGVATLSISYYELGYATGEMAAKILKGEANIKEMPVQFAKTVTKKYNKANCEALELPVPEGYVAIGE